jgi:hypothetical protein
MGPGDLVRPPVRCLPVEPGTIDGLLYPDFWGDPIRLTTVELMANACVFVRTTGDEPSAPGRAGHVLLPPRYAEVGVLAPAKGEPGSAGVTE